MLFHALREAALTRRTWRSYMKMRKETRPHAATIEQKSSHVQSRRRMQTPMEHQHACMNNRAGRIADRIRYQQMLARSNHTPYTSNTATPTRHIHNRPWTCQCDPRMCTTSRTGTHNGLHHKSPHAPAKYGVTNMGRRVHQRAPP